MTEQESATVTNPPHGELQNRLRLIDPVSAQLDVLLRRVVRPNTQCEYGLTHGFGEIRTVQDFQRLVPLCRYENLRADIERMVAGEQGILTTEPVRRFFMTSGSTTTPKYIPVTSSFVRDKWRAFQAYWAMVRQDHPETVHGHRISNFSDGSRESTTPGGAMCSSESSFWGTFGGGDRNPDHPLPREILNIADPEARYYTIARILLEKNVAILMALNPSTIVRMLEVLERYAGELGNDLRRGGLSSNMAVEPEVRRYVAERYRGNAECADRLKAAFAEGSTAPVRWLWPGLKLAISWRSPMVRPYLDILERYLGELPQRDYLTMASEGVMAIPFEDGGSGGALAADIHFYEFIPEDLAELADPPTLLPHQLERGSKYVVVISNSAGLYRYNIGDVVRVRDFIGNTPVIEFLYRTGSTCSLTGEKLTEEQVAHAVYDAAGSLGLGFSAFTLCPVARPFPHYALLTEVEDGTDHGLLVRFIRDLDEALFRGNGEYLSKRSSRRLGAPELWILRPGSYEELRQQKVAAGVSDAQIKLSCLTRDPDWHSRFDVTEKVSCE